MAKVKCSECNSENTVPILYGMPSYEAFEQSKRGELHIGGCCITFNDPDRHCNECGNDFFSKD